MVNGIFFPFVLYRGIGALSSVTVHLFASLWWQVVAT
ncbi:hypothetical protein T4A_13209 [Trichinella pseudospiralis]|uniref:Transmembrane protein n=1 Tax=Trichinella pseudospiralis TaxID=6337 RepID=A0A0V1DSH5_TRIPS|nr:hypothetical protein T4A_13209 [Trichinella pseudospiralis]